MVLEQLLSHLPDARFDRCRLRPIGGRKVEGITPDSRRAGPAMVFVSLPERQRENPFQIKAALEREAAVVICDPASPAPRQSACVRVPDAHAAFAQAAACFHDHPSRHLHVFGVAGEAGERGRLAAVLAGLLSACGEESARLGSETCEAAGRRMPWAVDRLDAFQIQCQLAAHLKTGGRSCVIEILPQLLVGGQLADVEFTSRFAASSVGSSRLVPETLTTRGSRIRMEVGGRSVASQTRLVGRSQANALAQAAVIVEGMGMPVNRIVRAFPSVAPCAGLLEPLLLGEPFGVLIDTARDSASLSAALKDARELASGRLIVMTGPPQGIGPAEAGRLAEAASLADEVIVTSDNARREEFRGLTSDFVGQLTASTIRVEFDRFDAVRMALQGRAPGDVVVLAGKGSFGNQRVGDAVIPWNERRYAADVLAQLGYAGREF